VTRASWYPPADRSQDRSRFSGIEMSRVTKLLLHSTETQGWPGYPNFAPQFTYDPWKHLWRQHMRLPLSASTLADPRWTAVRENRDDIVQVEIVGYCDPGRWADYGKNVEKMDARALRDLGKFAAWLHREWSLPLRQSVTWVSYPKSYGLKAAQRLSSSKFDAYTGLLGHQHASGNSHGDPGRINIAAILDAAIAEGDDDMPLSESDIDKIQKSLLEPDFVQKFAEVFMSRDGIVPNTFPHTDPKNTHLTLRGVAVETGNEFSRIAKP
jgi:hypothetical protein